MSRKEKKKSAALQDIRLDIPEDEIWTYQCQGMVGNTERIYVIEFNLHHGRWQLVKI